MAYFAGIFDAEGTVSLAPNGAFNISLEISHEIIPQIFQENFGGSIYERKRDNRKKTWIWKINSINDQALCFLDDLLPFSVVKKSQMKRLQDYLLCSREERKKTRSLCVSTIKNLKQPLPIKIPHAYPRIEKPTDESFAEWLAGFIDGDGNFVCNIYKDNRNGQKYFARQISAASIYLDALIYIYDRIPGSFTKSQRTKNSVYKWVCKRNHEEVLCKSISPFLIIKKEQCKLFNKFIHSSDDHERFSIIDQIKHYNSL